MMPLVTLPVFEHTRTLSPGIPHGSLGRFSKLGRLSILFGDIRYYYLYWGYDTWVVLL
jgi:hypothetical protein